MAALAPLTRRRWLCRASLCALLLASALVHADDSARTDAEALRAAVAGQRARAPAPRFERADFLVWPGLRGVRLSPDGRQVAYVREQGRNQEIWLQATAGGAPRRLLGRSDARELHWSRDSRWLLLESPRELFALAVAGQTGSGIVTTLGGREQRRLEAVDATAPAAVIVSEQRRAGASTQARSRLWRLAVAGPRTLLHESEARITGFAFAPDGRLAWLQRVEGEALVIRRADAKGGWPEHARCLRLQRCSLVAASNGGRDLLLRSDVDSALQGLQRLDGDGRWQSLHTDPRGEADLDQLVLDPLSQQPLVASYRSTRAANHALDPELAPHLARLAQALPQRDLRLSIGRGAQARWLVNERGSDLQGERWHLYDPRHGQLEPLSDGAPLTQRDNQPARWLPADALATKLPFAWRGSDGRRLHGFLSLPPGADPARVALIANVHGGPWNHVRPEFSAITQFLVNRGYAVFEPNFRGSTGHGRDYLLAAAGDYGNGRVQQDIVDGVRHLLAQGIGDRERVGITGGSFGGYATLLGLTFAPELFKVGVAVVPPPDFAVNLRWIARSPEALALSSALPFDTWLRLVSLDPADGAAMARLQAQSPLSHAASLRRPLLLLASGEDRRVAISAVIEYAARLKLAGKDVSLFIDPDAGHANDDPLAREANLYLLEKMLQRHLGGIAATAPGGELRRYLDRNLRIAGPGWRPDTATAP